MLLRTAITLLSCLLATSAWADPSFQLAAKTAQNSQDHNPEFIAISKIILDLTNQIRIQQGVLPLKGLTELDHAATYHSKNMARQNFFSHTDPEGLRPSDRLKKLHPELWSRSSGENIAMRTAYGNNPEDIARNLVLQWKNSPGHFKNMIAKDFTHLGVGVAYRGHNIYATQVFAQPVVRLETPLKPPILAGTAVKLKLRFLATFPPDELYLYLKVPDRTARFYTDSGSYYTGGGPLKPKWLAPDLVEINILTDKGIGNYRLGVGQNGSYAPAYQFDTLPPTPTH